VATITAHPAGSSQKAEAEPAHGTETTRDMATGRTMKTKRKQEIRDAYL